MSAAALIRSAGVLAVAILAVAAGPAQARHDLECPDYTTEEHFHSNDDAVTAAVVLGAEGVYEILDRVDQPLGKDIAAIFLFGAETANAVVQGINRAAEETCYQPTHMALEDELMKFTIHAGLASTTRADSSFLLPEKRQKSHIGPVRDHRTGWLDRERDNAEDDHEQQNGAAEVDVGDVLGVKTSVRFTIDAMKNTGQCTCTAAETTFDNAVAAVTAKNFKTAYRLFRQAYTYAFTN